MKHHLSILSTTRAGSYGVLQFTVYRPVVIELMQPGRILGQFFSRDGGKTDFAVYR